MRVCPWERGCPARNGPKHPGKMRAGRPRSQGCPREVCLAKIPAAHMPRPEPPLVLPALPDYDACIMSRQYTIRAVPAEVDRALRQRARREAKSLNAVVVEALTRSLGLEAEPVRHTDLDHLIGTWQEDPEFDRAVADFERVDHEAWK